MHRSASRSRQVAIYGAACSASRLKAIVDALPLRPGLRVIEIGCGPGAAAREVAEHVGASGHVLAVDRSAKAIALLTESAAALISAGRLTPRQVAVEELELEPGEDRYDVAFAVRVGAFDGRDPKAGSLALHGHHRFQPARHRPWRWPTKASAVPTSSAVGDVALRLRRRRRRRSPPTTPGSSNASTPRRSPCRTRQLPDVAARASLWSAFPVDRGLCADQAVRDVPAGPNRPTQTNESPKSDLVSQRGRASIEARRGGC